MQRALGFVAILALLVFGCADSPPSRDDSIAAVEQFRAAIEKGDTDAAKKFLADDPRLWYEKRAGEGVWNP